MTAKIISIKNSPASYYILITGILFFALFYIYCVNASVRNVVTREQTEQKISNLQNKMSELEQLYALFENSVTLEEAENLGLSEPKSKIFISRNPVVPALSLNKP